MVNGSWFMDDGKKNAALGKSVSCIPNFINN